LSLTEALTETVSVPPGADRGRRDRHAGDDGRGAEAAGEGQQPTDEQGTGGDPSIHGEALRDEQWMLHR
jgi:hypothetical protein